MPSQAKNMKSLFILSAAFLFIISAQSCKTYKIHVSGIPANAHVYYKGRYRADAPTKIGIPRKEKDEAKIEVDLKGYKRKTIAVQGEKKVFYELTKESTE